MMSPSERVAALQAMHALVEGFYAAATRIGNHPFLEFTGVMKAYVQSCERAHAAGVDFTECNQHAGQQLPMEGFEIDYLNEKLNCIFGGRLVALEQPQGAPHGQN